MISQCRMAMLKMGCRSLRFVFLGKMNSGRGLTERKTVLSAEERLPGLRVSKGGALLVSLAAKTELKKDGDDRHLRGR